MKKYLLIINFSWLMACPLYSCKKLIKIESPKTQISIDKVFSDDNSATSAISSLYSRLSSTTFDLYLTSLPALSADELIYPAGTFDQFVNNKLTPTDYYLTNFIWPNLYSIIYGANSILEGLNLSSNVNENLKAQLIGEAKVIRALCYFYLVNCFGDVPLITNTDVRISSIASRSSITDVYQLIIGDLLDGQRILSSNYPSADRARVNKWVATALLARSYLYNGEWAKAETESTSIINSGIYYLEPDLNNVFIKSSKETVWHIWNQNGFISLGFIPASSNTTPSYLVRQALIGSSDTGDLRIKKWIGTKVLNGISYYFPNKYKLNNINATSNSEYNVVLRIAEVYLIRAESRVKLNNVNGAVADLNMIRNRAGLSSIFTSSQNSVLDSIIGQDRIEFMFEWGHRWFDLKRTNRLDVVLGAIKPTWVSTAYLYPIPQAEINNNGFLTQNSGYE
jgi:starch-binding outer membrane protein, SusD/RagB family